MFSSHLKMALRSMSRHKVVSAINIVGLAVGIACCVLMLLWVQFETSYDDFHENLENIYLVGTQHQYGTDLGWSMQSPPALGPAMAAEYPEVKRVTRINSFGTHVLKHKDVEFAERLSRADKDFFKIFSFRFIAGDPSSVLSNRRSIVMTESMAKKYFGDESALGKTVRMDYEWDMTVTGVVADMPSNSTVRFRILVPFEFTELLPGREQYLTTWYNCSFYTYAQLLPTADADALGAKVAGRIERSDPETNLSAYVFPFSDLNLHSVSGSGGFISVLITFSGIALVVLVIACINFMNLATARAGDRAREVGVRKVVGATRHELVAQFYFESMLQALLALIVAFLLVEQFLPSFRELLPWLDVRLDLTDPVLVVGALGVAVVAGVLAGSYPALLLSSFKPATVLKGAISTGTRGAIFRRVLVVAQFGATVVILICALAVYKQFEFMTSKPVGYNRENLIYTPMDATLKDNFDSFKHELMKGSGVVAVAKASRSLSGIYTNGTGWDWEGRDSSVSPLITYLGVGLDYQEVVGVELVEGRFFSQRDVGQPGSDIVINEAFARILGEGSAIGKILRHDDHGDRGITEYTVVGVVRDFHYKPVHHPIGPLIIEFDDARSNNYVFIRIAEDARTQALAHVESVFRDFRPDRLFEVTWVEHEYENLYRYVQRRGDILKYFAVIAVFVSCLGLYGLASFMTEQRSKEIGIRKVVGASAMSVAYHLTREFVRWVVVANLIAWPAALTFIRGYLEGFSYRADVSWYVFPLVALFSVLLATIAVAAQALRAAFSDPVKAIRYE